MIFEMRIVVLFALLALPLRSSAVVVASGASGFVVREEVVFSGTSARAWRRLIQPQDWWGSEHTYSQNAGNLSLTLQSGGCFCERLAPHGFVRHMEVVLVQPGTTLRLFGGLGPLQGIGASGALTFRLSADLSGTTKVVAEYAVTGYSADGFAKLADAVDGVLGEQLRRFATSR